MAKDQPKIWCSDVLEVFSLNLDVTFEAPPPLERGEDWWLWRYQRGEKVQSEDFPKTLRVERALKELPPVFKATGNVLVVKERVKQLLEQFRLGDTQFVEVPILDAWRGSTYEPEGPFYILNIAERRRVFKPDQSGAVRQYESGRWGVLGDPDRIAASPVSPDDIDLWVDPYLTGTVFLSAPLAQAIKAAKIRNIKTWPCRAAV